MSQTATMSLLRAAKEGDRSAFDGLFQEHIPKLRGVLRRLVGHPDDVDDLAQQTLLKAFEGIATFRGASSPGTWLCSIGARLAVDHLRARKRWRERAQVIFASECLQDPQKGADVGTAMMSPDFAYDVNEHISYCFTCIGRTLEPTPHAALVLRDVLDLSNAEAAKALNLSTSVMRHHLADARKTMQQTFEGLCALVNKQGVCWQCRGLRDAVPEDKRGPEPPSEVSWEARMAIVRNADLDDGVSQALHDVFFRHTETQEETRSGDENAVTDCGREDAPDDEDKP